MIKPVYTQILRIMLAVLVAGITLALAVRGTNWDAVWRSLKSAEIGPILLAGLAIAAGMIFKAARWWVLLRAVRVSASGVMAGAAYFAGALLNWVYPLRVGEISRVAAAGADQGDYAPAAGAVAVEKVLDLGVFGILILIQLESGLRPDWLDRSSVPVLFLVAAAGLVGTVWLALRLELVPLDRFRDAWSRQAEQLRRGWEGLRRPQTWPVPLGLTAAVWLAAVIPNWLILRAVGLDLPPAAALLTLIALQIGISIPALPGRLGVFQYACILALGAYGVDPERGLSYGILLHGVVAVPVVAFGLPSLVFLFFQRRK